MSSPVLCDHHKLMKHLLGLKNLGYSFPVALAADTGRIELGFGGMVERNSSLPFLSPCSN